MAWYVVGSLTQAPFVAVPIDQLECNVRVSCKAELIRASERKGEKKDGSGSYVVREVWLLPVGEFSEPAKATIWESDVFSLVRAAADDGQVYDVTLSASANNYQGLSVRWSIHDLVPVAGANEDGLLDDLAAS